MCDIRCAMSSNMGPKAPTHRISNSEHRTSVITLTTDLGLSDACVGSGSRFEVAVRQIGRAHV